MRPSDGPSRGQAPERRNEGYRREGRNVFGKSEEEEKDRRGR